MKKVSNVLEITTQGVSFDDLDFVNKYGAFDFRKVVPIPSELDTDIAGDEFASVVCFLSGGFSRTLPSEMLDIANKFDIRNHTEKDFDLLIESYSSKQIFKKHLNYYYKKGKILCDNIEKYNAANVDDYKIKNGCGNLSNICTGKNVLTFDNFDITSGAIGNFLGHIANKCNYTNFYFVADFNEYEKDSYFECEIRKGSIFNPVFYGKGNIRKKYEEEIERRAFLKTREVYEKRN